MKSPLNGLGVPLAERISKSVIHHLDSKLRLKKQKKRGKVNDGG